MALTIQRWCWQLVYGRGSAPGSSSSSGYSKHCRGPQKSSHRIQRPASSGQC